MSSRLKLLHATILGQLMFTHSCSLARDCFAGSLRLLSPSVFFVFSSSFLYFFPAFFAYSFFLVILRFCFVYSSVPCVFLYYGVLFLSYFSLFLFRFSLFHSFTLVLYLSFWFYLFTFRLSMVFFLFSGGE